MLLTPLLKLMHQHNTSSPQHEQQRANCPARQHFRVLRTKRDCANAGTNHYHHPQYESTSNEVNVIFVEHKPVTKRRSFALFFYGCNPAHQRFNRVFCVSLGQSQFS
jgi:hypothetical protein